MFSINDVLNQETERFIEALQEASEYGVQIIMQFDDADPRKQRLLESFQTEIQTQSDVFQDKLKNIVSHINDLDPASADIMQVPSNELITEQLQALSGYHISKCWEAVVGVAMRVLQPEQRKEINAYVNFQQVDEDYRQYEDFIFQCREQESKNINVIQRYQEGLDILKQSAIETDDLRAKIKENRDVIIKDYDQAVRQLADQCQIYIQQIEHIQSEIYEKKQQGESMKSVLRIKPNERDQNLMTLKQTIQIINDVYAARQREAELLLKKGRGQATSLKLFTCQYFFTNYYYEPESDESLIKSATNLKSQNKQKNRPERFFYSLSFYAQTNIVCAVFQAEFDNLIDEDFKFAAAAAEERLDQIYNKQVQLTGVKEAENPEVNQTLLFAVLNTFYGDDNESVSQVQVKFENSKTGNSSKENQFQLLKKTVALYEFRKRKEQLGTFVELFKEKDHKQLGVISRTDFVQIIQLVNKEEGFINKILESKEMSNVGTVPFTTAVRLLGKAILQPVKSFNQISITQ